MFVSVVENVDVDCAVQEAINLIGGIETFVRPHDKVIIKPNLVLARPSDSGLTTDPRVVQAIIELCINMNPSDLTIAEGSGGVIPRSRLRNVDTLSLHENMMLSSWT